MSVDGKLDTLTSQTHPAPRRNVIMDARENPTSTPFFRTLLRVSKAESVTARLETRPKNHKSIHMRTPCAPAFIEFYQRQFTP